MDQQECRFCGFDSTEECLRRLHLKKHKRDLCEDCGMAGHVDCPGQLKRRYSCPFCDAEPTGNGMHVHYENFHCPTKRVKTDTRIVIDRVVCDGPRDAPASSSENSKEDLEPPNISEFVPTKIFPAPIALLVDNTLNTLVAEMDGPSLVGGRPDRGHNLYPLDFHLFHPNVSRAHGLITYKFEDGQSFFVLKRLSANTIYVDGQVVEESLVLKDGSVMRFSSDSHCLRFCVQWKNLPTVETLYRENKALLYCYFLCHGQQFALVGCANNLGGGKIVSGPNL